VIANTNTTKITQQKKEAPSPPDLLPISAGKSEKGRGEGKRR